MKTLKKLVAVIALALFAAHLNAQIGFKNSANDYAKQIKNFRLNPPSLTINAFTVGVINGERVAQVKFTFKNDDLRVKGERTGRIYAIARDVDVNQQIGRSQSYQIQDLRKGDSVIGTITLPTPGHVGAGELILTYEELFGKVYSPSLKRFIYTDSRKDAEAVYDFELEREVVDLDHDQVDDGTEDQILARFRPFYKFSNDGGDEKRRPADPLWYIKHSDFYSSDEDHPKFTVAQLTQNPGLILQPEERNQPSSDMRIHPSNTKHFINVDNQFRNGETNWSIVESNAVGLFGHVTRLFQDPSNSAQITAYKVEYWQFYAYNDAGAGPAGEHEGDWEGVELVVEPDQRTISQITHHIHSTQVTFQIAQGRRHQLDANFIEYEGTANGRPYRGYIDLNIAGPAGIDRAQNNLIRFYCENGECTHPVAYIENGGHASWPTQYWSWPFVNNHNGSSHSYLTKTPPNLGEIGYPLSQSPASDFILHFNGHWGGGDNAPTGPPLKWSWGR